MSTISEPKHDKLVYMLSAGYDVAAHVAEFIYCNLSSWSTESVVEFHPCIHIAGLDVLCLLKLSTFMYTNPYVTDTYFIFYVVLLYYLSHPMFHMCDILLNRESSTGLQLSRLNWLN